MSQYRVNMHGTMNLLEAARLTGVRRFVMASTRTVYPSFEGTVHGHPSYAPVPEDHWTEPNRPYEVWKHASERIGSYYQEQYGLEFCAFRFGIYLAAERAAAAEAGVGGQRPMGKLHAIIHNAVKSRATTLPQGGDRLLDLVYVRDIAQAFVAAIDAPAIPETVYNIGGGSPVTLETFIGALETVIPGTDIECGPGIDFAPGHYCVLDISRAERDLGYSPAWSLEALLQDCVARARNLLDTR
jgi:UDP-glucose 4-epimerase